MTISNIKGQQFLLCIRYV